MDDQILDNDFYPNTSADEADIVYAGFWVRVAAAIIDALVLIPISFFISWNLYTIKSSLILVVVTFLISLYKPLMEGFYGATLGKMTLNLKVVDLDFRAIDLTTAFKRYTPWLFSQCVTLITQIKLLNTPGFEAVNGWFEVVAFQQEYGYTNYALLGSLVIYISVLALLFDNQKQGLHDQFAGTYCIYK